MPSWFRSISRRLGTLEVVVLLFTLVGSLAIWHASAGPVRARVAFSIAQLCLVLLFIKVAFASIVGSRAAPRSIEWTFAVIVDLAIVGVVISILLG